VWTRSRSSSWKSPSCSKGWPGIAIGYRVYRLPATDANEAYLARIGPQLRLLGPLLLLGAAILPGTVYEADDGNRRACGIGLEVFLAGAVVFAIRTWRREPAVTWPRTLIAWLQYLVSVLIWGGVVAGAFVH
jgi:hypothetical protein